MAKVIIGNASAITVPRQDRHRIRKFYCDVLGGKIVKEDNEKDVLRLEEDFYMLFRYGDVPDESKFLRSTRSLWLQIKSDNVEEMTRKILDFGARKIDLPSGLLESVPYLYFQAPGGQCFQLLPTCGSASVSVTWVFGRLGRVHCSGGSIRQARQVRVTREVPPRASGRPRRSTARSSTTSYCSTTTCERRRTLRRWCSTFSRARARRRRRQDIGIARP
jgi:Glyoxalase-like domain